MKEKEKIISSIAKLRAERKKRILYLGLFLMVFALLISTFAYFSHTDYINQFVTVTHEENESYYMISSVFVVMGLFCLNSIRGS